MKLPLKSYRHHTISATVPGWIFAALLTAFLAGCATTQEPLMKFGTASSGTEKMIYRIAFWNADCSAQDFSIRVDIPPKHGKLSFRPRSRKVRNVEVGDSCVGVDVDGKAVLYQSNSEFKGQDEAVVTYLARRVQLTHKYIISVH